MITIVLLLLFVAWISRQRAVKIEDTVNGINDLGKRMEMLNQRATAYSIMVIAAAAAFIIMITMIYRA